MRELDEVMQFLFDALSTNAARGQNSVVTIRVTPYAKKEKAKQVVRTITENDVLDAHEALEQFDGNFRKIFDKKIS